MSFHMDKGVYSKLGHDPQQVSISESLESMKVTLDERGYFAHKIFRIERWKDYPGLYRKTLCAPTGSLRGGRKEEI